MDFPDAAKVITHRFPELPPRRRLIDHATHAEMVFIKHLGRWAQRELAPRAMLLQCYLDACISRGNWDGIASEKVLRFAREELQKETEETKAT